MITEYLTDSPEALTAIADTTQPKNVVINGSQTFIFTGADYMPDLVTTMMIWA